MRADCSVLFDSKSVIRKEFVIPPYPPMMPAGAPPSSSNAVRRESPKDHPSSPISPGDIKFGGERLFSSAAGVDSLPALSNSIWTKKVVVGNNNNALVESSSVGSLYSLPKREGSHEEEHHKEDPDRNFAIIERLRGELQLYRQRMEFLEKRNRNLEDQLLEMNEKYLNLENKLLSLKEDQAAAEGAGRYELRSSRLSSGSMSSGRYSSRSTEEGSTSSSQDPEQAAVRAIIDAYSNRGICRHYIQGRCRYKAQCKFSHEVDQCPFCQESLPRSKIASSTHLARCFKLVTHSEIPNP